ncbi:hypothetical protein JGU72_16980 [Antrihabitans sp. YC2-6]|nr:hypothetical protein [Antrihabitans sp. YC2-6]
MCAARLSCYLAGGRPPGGLIDHAGARDKRPPAATLALTLPGTVFFAGESRTWGGGRAYYDPTTAGRTPARGYLLSSEQFDDLRAQEPPVYDRLLELGVRDGARMLTFTSSYGKAAVENTHPAPEYLSIMAEGIAETHGWTAAEITKYLENLMD